MARLRVRKPPHLRKFSFDRLRQAVRLYTGGKSFTEVGMEMGVSKARAQQLYHEAVKLWKERNLEQSPEEPPDCPVCGHSWPAAVTPDPRTGSECGDGPSPTSSAPGPTTATEESGKPEPAPNGGSETP